MDFVLTPEMLNANAPKDLSKYRKEPPDTYPALEKDKCISCNLCFKNCLQGAIEMMDIPGSEKVLADGKKGKPKKIPIFDYSKCLWCQLCEDNCKPMALNFIHKDEAASINRKNLESIGGKRAAGGKSDD